MVQLKMAKQREVCIGHPLWGGSEIEQQGKHPVWCQFRHNREREREREARDDLPLKVHSIQRNAQLANKVLFMPRLASHAR